MELRRIIHGFLFPLLDCNSRIYTVNEREESPLLLRQMKYFAAVVDQNSFTEAAGTMLHFPIGDFPADQSVKRKNLGLSFYTGRTAVFL